jgi:copper chaperone
MTTWVLEVEGMTCGGCATSVRRALEAAAPGSVVEVELERRRARVEGGDVDPDALREAVLDAGFEVRALTDGGASPR